MKKLLLPALLLFTFFFQSCHSELDLTADWKDIPVVYGLLSLNDTAHYIRVEKAFLDDTSDANDLAQVADSLYYDESVVVQLTRDATGETFDLQRVDGNLEGYPKDDGTFATSPNWLYKIGRNDINLVGGEQYNLTIKRSDNLPDITSETVVVKSLAAQKPLEGQSLNIREGVETNIRWRATNEARVFDVILTFHFREFTAGEPFEDKTITWVIDRGVGNTGATNDSQKATFDGFSFYTLLNTTLTASDNITRNFQKLSLDIIGGASDLEEFIRITQANTGITSAQEIPSYSNLSEGLGIFSSINTLHLDSVDISPATITELRENELTKDLNF